MAMKGAKGPNEWQWGSPPLLLFRTSKEAREWWRFYLTAPLSILEQYARTEISPEEVDCLLRIAEEEIYCLMSEQERILPYGEGRGDNLFKTHTRLMTQKQLQTPNDVQEYRRAGLGIGVETTADGIAIPLYNTIPENVLKVPNVET